MPFTTAVVLLLVLVPGFLLTRWSRPRAAGLEQLIGASSLLQSFPPTPDRPVPALWSERLGSERAARLWRGQAKVWWQFWATHSESAPYLALSADPSISSKAPLPANALKVGDLVVYAEDPIARQQLLASLRPLQRRSRGLAERCHQRLQSGQAVFWQADALGTILGPVAPLLERYQVGCLSLALEPDALRWQGEASGAVVAPPGLGGKGAATAGAPRSEGDGGLDPGSAVSVTPLPPQPPLPDALLLELEGSSLDHLLEGLLARQMIRDPLASRYGLEGPALARVRQAPFRLRLHPLPEGPFRASLDLLIPVGPDRPIWDNLLERLQRTLKEQGFSAAEGTALEGLAPLPAQGSGLPKGPAPTSAERAAQSPGSSSSVPGTLSRPSVNATPGNTPAPSAAPPQPGSKAAKPAPAASPASLAATGTTWKRADGTAVGGWRWLQGQNGQAQLLLFLGPPPLAPLPMAPDQGFRSSPSQFSLRGRPAALDALGLLPPEMPALTRLGQQLWLNSDSLRDPASERPISRLTGRLQLRR